MKVTRFTIHAALEPGMIKVYRLEIIGGVLERVCIMEAGNHTENSVSHSLFKTEIPSLRVNKC